MKQLPSTFKTWLTFIFVTLLFLIAFFLRTFRLKETLQFSGDEGRDAIIVSQIFLKHDPVFIGPVTSVGNMYLGPMYYYFMLPFLRLSFPSPMGPVWAVAILGCLTVVLIYFLGKKMFDQKVALIATFFYAFSATVIQLTRFSWNPNPVPLISLLMIYFIYLAQSQPKKWWLVILMMSIIVQLHYLTLLAVGTGGVIWLIQFIGYWRQRHKLGTQLKQMLIGTGIGVAIFLMSLTPLVLFDLKHDFLNTRSFQYLLTKEENFSHSTRLPLAKKIGETIYGFEGRTMLIMFELYIGQKRALNAVLVKLVWVVLGLIFWLDTKKQRQNKITAQQIVIIFFAVGIFGTAMYQHSIFDHYVAYLFPVAAYVYGMVIKYLLADWPKLSQQAWYRSLINFKRILACLFVFAFTIYYLQFNSSQYNYNPTVWTVDQMADLASRIKQTLPENEAYSLVMVGPSKDYYGQNYRYFLTALDRPPVDPLYNDQSSLMVLILEDELTFDLPSSEIHELQPFKSASSIANFKIEPGPRIIILRK